ncbi:hypothetical protein L7F22_051394 [Adiantum nelumboides]|nr:hypothetical protein [Adiantum nelumboides]
MSDKQDTLERKDPADCEVQEYKHDSSMDQNSKSDVQAFVPLGNKTIDAALALANEGPIAYEASEGRALLRKLDLRLIPLLCWVYALQFADKTTLNYASVMGVREDTHLTGQEYSYVSSIFYAGYIAAQPFIAYSLKRFSLGKFTAINVGIWGAILACHAACTSYAGLMIARSLLGAFEAVITPAFLLFVSVWYPRSQQARRVGYWLCCNGVATLICAPIAFGLSGIAPGTLAIDSWQILFLLFGLVTAVTGVVYWFVLPDTQANAKFLSHREKRIAIDLIRENFQGVGSSKKFDRAQLREAFVDPATYLIFFFSLFMNIPNGGVTTFGSLVIKSFGFNSRQALLLGMPGGFVDLAFKLVFTRLSDRFNDRTGFAMVAIFFPFLGGPLDDHGPLQRPAGPPARLLLHLSRWLRMGSCHDPHLQQLARLHQEAHSQRSSDHCLWRRQLDRTEHVPSKRSTGLPHRKDTRRCLLRSCLSLSCPPASPLPLAQQAARPRGRGVSPGARPLFD